MKNFKFDNELKIYTCPGALPVDYSDGGEEYLLDIFKNIKEIKSDAPELLTYIKDWASMYHLSLRRTNVMKAVAAVLDKDSAALELGSGCGVITRWLGENFRSVDAVEGSRMRAVVTRERTRDLANVSVYCGNMLGISFHPDRYGLVTLNGVMEYIPYYTKDVSDPKRPCIDFLKRINTTLEEKGVLFIAIENKLGAKYFTGCAEDHSKLFEGLIGYPNKTPVTFSRNELQEMLSASGFNNIQFFHPFPDYKLPETIFRESDETLSLYPHNWIRTPFEDYSGTRPYLMAEPLLLKTIVQAELLWHFSNSFVVLASRSSKINLQTEWLIKKFFNNDMHKPVFHHTVSLTKHSNNYHIKRERICLNDANPAQQNIGFNLLETDKFIAGELLIFEAYKGLMSDFPMESMIRMIKEVHDNLLLSYNCNEVDEHGYHLVDKTTVDFVFWNLIRSSDGSLHFIDRKWSLKENIPADFVLFRNLWGLYSSFAPFIKQKDSSIWIIDIIRTIYLSYDFERFKKNISLEESFQSAVSIQSLSLNLSGIQHPSLKEYNRLQTELAERDRQIHAMINSWSWRITAPLRKIMGFFTQMK